MKIIWSAQYELGIEVIDNQHKRIVDYINALYDLELQGANKAATEDIFYNLIDYTYSHFEFEQALLNQAHYQEASLHQISHKTFCHQIDTLKNRFDHGENVAAQLGSMLRNWLLQHILTEDAAYSGCVKQHINDIMQGRHEHWVVKAVERYFSH